MKASTVKLLCFTVGIFLLWLTLLVIATNFYFGLIGVVVADVEGGQYRALLFENTLARASMGSTSPLFDRPSSS